MRTSLEFTAHEALRRPRRAALAAALALALPAASISVSAQAIAASPLLVTNCNDGGPGSLRDTIASAPSGALVNLSQLTCSTITLTSGAIEIPQNDLYLKYSGEHGTPPTISGNLHDRVFHHTGSGTLRLVALTLTEGKYDNTSIYQAVPAAGGCIYSSGSVYLAGSTLSHCTARDTRGEDAVGGGVYALKTVTLLHSVVSANTATSTARFADGGGVFTHGALVADYSSISGNVASGLGYENFGGGIAIVNAGGALSTIAHSTIDGNRADRGGGLFVSGTGNDGAAITITNSTISGNTANAYAAAAYLKGSVTIASSTLAFNQSTHAGPGVELVSTGPVVFNSSILARNTGENQEYDVGDQGVALTISGADNLVVLAAPLITLPAHTLGSDPLLLPLADNGGPTRTHALGEGSPAINAGDNVAGLAADQRGTGYPRVFGTAADIGAYERQTVDDTIFANGFDP